MPDSSDKIDTHVQVVTPENIAFEYRVAGPFSRVMAYLVDLGILMVTYGVVALVSMIVFMSLQLPGVGMGVMLASFFLLYWFYGGMFETFWNGQTPGKRMLGLRVLRTDGRPVSASQAVMRNLLRVADAQLTAPPAMYYFPSFLVGLLMMTITKRYQRVGDLAVGTMVVAEDRQRFGKVPVPQDPGISELLENVPANFIPSRTLARALSHYVGRRRFFGPARRQEIARHVGSLLVERLNMAPDTDHDLLLCALYLRAFHEGNLEDQGTPDALIAPRVPIPVEPAPSP